MKNALSIAKVIFIAVLSILSLTNVSAQNIYAVNYQKPVASIAKINGDNLVENLLFDRNEFVKKIAKSSNLANLPKAKFIFDTAYQTVISFSGLDFVIENNEVVAIKGLTLSREILSQITEKLVFLDRVQFYYSEKSNMNYLNPNSDIQEIKFLDKQFATSIKILNTTLKDIASFTKSENPSQSVEANISKMREPNIDKSIEKQTIESFARLKK